MTGRERRRAAVAARWMVGMAAFEGPAVARVIGAPYGDTPELARDAWGRLADMLSEDEPEVDAEALESVAAWLRSRRIACPAELGVLVCEAVDPTASLSPDGVRDELAEILLEAARGGKGAD